MVLLIPRWGQEPKKLKTPEQRTRQTHALGRRKLLEESAREFEGTLPRGGERLERKEYSDHRLLRRRKRTKKRTKCF